MKVCSKCKVPKEDDEFSLDKKKKDGRSYMCKECHKEYMESYYRKKKDKWKNVKQDKKKRVEENKDKLLSLLQTSSCKDCGNSDSRVLEFDHLYSKRLGVPMLVKHGYSWETIKKEIDKCEIVCSNCHRIRTFERLKKTYRNESRGRSNGLETGGSPVQDDRSEDVIS